MSQTTTRKPTEEQFAIISGLRSGIPKIEVGAFAGTGKTSLLEMCVEDMPRSTRFCYIVFNKSGEREAKERFARFDNIEIKTVNALAFANYPNRGDVKIAFYKRQDIERLLGLNYKQAKKTLDLFEAYCNSDAIIIENKHVQNLWDLMEIGKIDPTHSFILKTFHLNLATGIDLPISKKNFDVVMVDEYQDTNPVTLAIADLIRPKTYIKVGDRHQGIYGFRGANNIMGTDQEAVRYNLTNSFRFNQSIADKANTILSLYKNETQKLKGLSTKTSMQTACLLSRTNSELLTGIKTLYEAKEPFKTIRDANLIFDLPMSIHQLNNGGEARKSCFYLKWEYQKFQKARGEFGSFVEYLKDSAKKNNDRELITACKIVENIKHDTMKRMEETAHHYNGQKNLSVKYFLSTIHTAKGLEWDYVKIANDLYDLPAMIAQHIYGQYGDLGNVEKFDFIERYQEDLEEGNVDNALVEEFNLLYVAITRAKVKVDYPSLVAELLDRNVTNDNIKQAYKTIVEKEELQEQAKDIAHDNFRQMMLNP